MDAAPETPTVSADGAPAEEERIGWTVQRALGVLVALALIAFWVWAFSPWAPSSKADGVQDRAFLATAEASCRRMQEGLAALPPARDAKTAAERAETVTASAPIVSTMIAELRAASSSLRGRDAELVTQWLTDWDAYAADRQTYADALRTDDKAEFFVTRRGTGQITVTMDGFSRVNDLASCLVPQDV